jgi:hypothetical protein
MEMEIARKVHTRMQMERKQTLERKRATGRRSLPVQTLALPYQAPRRQTSQPPDRHTNDISCIVTSSRSEPLITAEEDKQLKLRTSHLAFQAHRGVCCHSLLHTVDSSRMPFPYHPDYTLSIITGVVTDHQILQSRYNLIS